MTTYRATFELEHVEGRRMDDELVATALEEVLEDVVDIFVQDDDDHESTYGVSLTRVEVAP